MTSVWAARRVHARTVIGFITTITCLAGAHSAFAADDKYDGYLCCNMRTDGSWISDINYAENGKTVIPVGTPVKVDGYGRYRVKIEVNGKKQAIGNDYSRDLSNDAFAHRYVVTANPADQIAQFPQAIRDAINSSHVLKGMTREQVLMSVGYPVSSENPDIKAKVWRFWLSSFNAEFRVRFDADDRVSAIEGDQDAIERVTGE